MKVFLALITILTVALMPAVGLAQTPPDVDLGHGWKLGVRMTVPLFEIRESVTEGARLDVIPVIGFGGGPVVYWTKGDSTSVQRILSIGPTVILSSRVDGGEQMDVKIGIVGGFFDDFIQGGLAWNAGITKVSRYVGLLSLGVKF